MVFKFVGVSVTKIPCYVRVEVLSAKVVMKTEQTKFLIAKIAVFFQMNWTKSIFTFLPFLIFFQIGVLQNWIERKRKKKKNLFYWLSNFKCHPNVTLKVDENTSPSEMSDFNDINPFENRN